MNRLRSVSSWRVLVVIPILSCAAVLVASVGAPDFAQSTATHDTAPAKSATDSTETNGSTERAKQTHRPARSKADSSRGTAAELRMERLLDEARSNPLELEAFLKGMPKGADLHNHLFGAIYAETFIREGAEDGLCVNLASDAFIPRPTLAEGVDPRLECGPGTAPATQAFSDQHLHDSLVDAFSMRGFMPTPGATGHDHFFNTFSKFEVLDARHFGEWLDEVATRAAAQNEQYLELMDTPDFSHAAAMAREVGWRDDFDKLRTALLARGLRDEVAPARARYDKAEADRRQREHCGQADEMRACRVEIRYLYQVLRGFPKEQVFAQTLLGFETAAADPRVVGINYVMAEDGYTSMADYALQMHMLGFFHKHYPKIHITLHAGELAPGLVPYEGLCCHIRLAVEQAHAERIGHGVDVMHEDRPYDLLREMAAKHVMVEINLTSNDVILGVTGKDHPLPIYRKYGVPVALSTDDEGVSRINLTHEYVRAVETYGLRYAELKQMVRTGIEHSFLPGASLWSMPDGFGRAVPACSRVMLGGDKPVVRCADFLNASEKARQQWDLERRFREFESSDNLAALEKDLQANQKAKK